MARVLEDPALTPRQCKECGESFESQGLYAQHYRAAHVDKKIEAQRQKKLDYMAQYRQDKKRKQEAIMPKNKEETRKYTVSLYLSPEQETELDALASLHSQSRSKFVQPILQAKIDEVLQANSTIVKQYLALRAKIKV